MKWIGSILLLFVAVLAGPVKAQNAAKPVPVFTVHGPTVVAFFTPVTEKELESDPDTNEALSDFQFYNGAVRGPFQEAGIEFRETDALSFKVRIGKRVQTFPSAKIGVGYYLVAPGKKPHIVSGVMTDTDLLDLARKYFGRTIPYIVPKTGTH
jgi:hypothetical protein